MPPHNFFRNWREAPWYLQDPGDGEAIPNSQVGTYHLTIAASASETNTLAAPSRVGLLVGIVAETVGSSGTRVVTVATAYDEAGNTTITFSASGQYVVLQSMKVDSVYVWRIVGFDGVAGPTTAMAAATMAGDFTVGSDGTGYDVTFYGDTASNYFLYDADTCKLSMVTALASQSTENISQSISLTTDSTFVGGTDVTWSGGYGSSALKITGTYTGVGGGFHGVYSAIATSGAQTASGAGVIGMKSVVTNTVAWTDGSLLAGQFIAKHNHGTNAMGASAAFIGLEAIAYISDAGAVGTAIGLNAVIRNYGGQGAGSVHRGIQVVCDQAGGTAAVEATGICIWNMAGTWHAALRISGAFNTFANFDDATTCFAAITSEAATVCGQILVTTAAGATGYINVYSQTGT